MIINLDINLKNLLKKNNMTLTQLSKATGIPVQTIHNWMHGQEPRSFIQVKKLANFFSISVDKLVYENNDEVPLINSASILKEFTEGLNLGIFEVVLRKPSNAL